MKLVKRIIEAFLFVLGGQNMTNYNYQFEKQDLETMVNEMNTAKTASELNIMYDHVVRVLDRIYDGEYRRIKNK